ncbi:MAG: uroporphyrinogen-III C-methyltransferase [Gammaproteobacteria bacterium]|nr:uroporphyrinogen-III C-methyltransferase [Gammaproteobacteria bacterium]NIR98592.1 uroporphyrinogen-III C-methyltransferase [Gammaproteobacteria bacterium]NIT64315.1 uroporphyrinogen-III C-methyltransferase [Gammaproteobacteria bacterium]NIV21239.1 uroporphyrinogen-III C-methyltransferase [Gammaproteobacteria bacterium]NIX10943.1 uroporphyrinogen-III C-methyltransferase [Gammaproteobacteria bacterium]
MSTASRVYLVGAGPGDPELLTVKAQRLLRSADAVVYDRLISQEILDQIPAGVTRIPAGKASGHHSFAQYEINELLVSLAGGGHMVVRLKGGDPFIFGRGGEEALHLVRHGISFEVVPGVTAAAACSAYAGIPLTHRGLTRGVRFITGQCRAGKPLDLDWDRVADPDATLVVYMGVANAEQISEALMEAGLDPSTPVAAIANGTTARQQRCLTTLVDLPEQLKRSRLQPPVTIVIGKVVTLASILDWFEPARSDSEGAREHILHA